MTVSFKAENPKLNHGRPLRSGLLVPMPAQYAATLLVRQQRADSHTIYDSGALIHHGQQLLSQSVGTADPHVNDGNATTLKTNPEKTNITHLQGRDWASKTLVERKREQAFLD